MARIGSFLRLYRMAHFYLTLPSNSSMLYYPDNTLTRYTTRLANAISLLGDWEVGLVEIQYPHTWNNLERFEGRISYSQALTQREEKPQSFLIKMFRLQAGYYNSIGDMAQLMNENIKAAVADSEIEKFPKFRYNAVTKRFNGAIPVGVSMHFSHALCTMLGIDASQNPINTEEEDEMLQWKSGRICDLQRGFSSMYVYCNVLEHVPVGDTKAPLLRIVRVTDRSGENVHTLYEKPLYVPLQQKNFDSIEIDIRSDVGNPIAFESGKVVVTLHFRRCKLPYLLQ